MKLNIKTIICLITLSVLNTGCLQWVVNQKVKEKIDGHYVVAIKNTSLENTTVPVIKAYFSHHAATPRWQSVLKIKDDSKRGSESFSSRANAFSNNDKNNHCYAGYLIAKELGYKEAVFSGYVKETQDAGDANPRTHFELADRDATNYGAKIFASGESSEKCHNAKELFR